MRFLGSPDIYGTREREPQVSLNFVTCHDGFTLEDLVSYDTKHNEANGEGNRDGNDQNLSWNCGVEGPTDDPAIDALRRRQIKNLLTLDVLALGAPMLLMGDEVRRTQGGNNNGYCHDDARTWFDWTLVERNAEILRFTTALTHLRRRFVAAMGHPVGLGLADILRDAAIEWSGVEVGAPDLGDDSHSVALTARVEAGALHVILNAWWEPLEFELPAPGEATVGWHRLVDTAGEPPHDIATTLAAATPVADRLPRRAARRGRAGGAQPGRPSGSGNGAMMPVDTERERMARGRPARRRASRAPAPGIAGGRTCASGPGARSARTTAPTATPGAPSRTTTPGRARTAGTRTAWPASPTSFNRLCLALALWNGRDPILKERMFGLTNGEGNHGEDVKEYWWYLDAVPSHAWLRWRYHYPQAAFPYEDLIDENAPPVQARAGVRAARHGHLRRRPLLDRRGPLRQGRPRRHPDAGHRPQRGPRDGHAACAADALVPQHLVVGPERGRRPALDARPDGDAIAADARRARRLHARSSAPAPDGSAPELLFCENETNAPRLFGADPTTPYPKDGINDHVVGGAATVNPTGPARRPRPGTGSTSPPAGPPRSALRLRPSGRRGARRRRRSAGPRLRRTCMTEREAEADAFYADLAAPMPPPRRRASCARRSPA